jgi:hypothetical protein
VIKTLCNANQQQKASNEKTRCRIRCNDIDRKENIRGISHKQQRKKEYRINDSERKNIASTTAKERLSHKRQRKKEYRINDSETKTAW